MWQVLEKTKNEDFLRVNLLLEITIARTFVFLNENHSTNKPNKIYTQNDLKFYLLLLYDIFLKINSTF